MCSRSPINFDRKVSHIPIALTWVSPAWGNAAKTMHTLPCFLQLTEGRNRLFCTAYTMKVCTTCNTTHTATGFKGDSTHYFDPLKLI